MRTNVYVDGFNLFYGSLKGTPYKWLDLDALCRRLLPKDEINRIRYFTAMISVRPGEADQSGPVRQETYLRALSTIPHLSVHLGEFYVTRPRMALANPRPGGPRTVEVIKTEEKGSDVALATYLMLDGCRKDCDAVVVVTNDADLREPLRLARNELGLTTGVINPHPPHRRSRALTSSFFKQIRSSVLPQCQFPSKLVDGEGRAIRKPAEWEGRP